MISIINLMSLPWYDSWSWWKWVFFFLWSKYLFKAVYFCGVDIDRNCLMCFFNVLITTKAIWSSLYAACVCLVTFVSGSLLRCICVSTVVTAKLLFWNFSQNINSNLKDICCENDSVFYNYEMLWNCISRNIFSFKKFGQKIYICIKVRD